MPWQNDVTYCQKHLLQTHVSHFCHTRNIVPAVLYVSAVKQKLTLLLETMLLVWQKRETLGKHVSASNVSGKRSPPGLNFKMTGLPAVTFHPFPSTELNFLKGGALSLGLVHYRVPPSSAPAPTNLVEFQFCKCSLE